MYYCLVVYCNLPLKSLDALNRPVFNSDQLKVLVDVGRAYLTDWEDRADARTRMLFEILHSHFTRSSGT